MRKAAPWPCRRLRRHRRLHNLPRARQAGLRPVALLLAIQISSRAVPPPSRLYLVGSTAATGVGPRGGEVLRESLALSTLTDTDTMNARAEVAELVDAPDSKSGGAQAPCGFDSHLRHTRHESRNPHRRRRLSRAERGHPGRGAALAGARGRRRRGPVRVARARRRLLRAARPARDLGPLAARRNDP